MNVTHIPEYGIIEDARRQQQLYGEEPIESELPEDLEALWHTRNNLVSILKAARAVKQEVDRAFAAQLVQGEGVQFGDDVHQVKHSFRRRVKDGDAFWSFVDSLPRTAVRRLFNPDTVRITELRAAAASQGITEKAVDDTFFETIWGEPTIKSTPEHLAPKWLQGMTHGERRQR